MKYQVVTAGLLTVLGAGAGAHAAPLIIKDYNANNLQPVGLDISAQVQQWNKGVKQNNKWVDVLGNQADFQTSQATVTIAANDVTIDFTTNMEVGGTVVQNRLFLPADLFLDLDKNGSWDYAVALTSHGTVVQGNLYDLAGPADYQTSMDLWSSVSLGIGGRYRTDSTDTVGLEAPVWVKGGTDAGDATVAWNTGASDPGQLSITIPGLLGLPEHLLSGTGFNFLWGTATCANDVVFGSIKLNPNTPVPEGDSVIAGLAVGGLAFAAWRRRAAKAAVQA